MTRTPTDCPVAPQSPNNIIVKLTADLTTGLGNVVNAGSFVEIDTAKDPEPGCTVLHAGNLAPWNGQANVEGVAVMFWEDWQHGRPTQAAD